MQIHELGTRTTQATDWLALDTNSQTYKAKTGQLRPEFTSHDTSNPTSWDDVAVISSSSNITTFFERLSYAVKNLRYLWKLIGSNAFSNVAETISGAIGNTALPTTATSLSGAIAEHESDISTINNKLSAETFTLTRDTTNTTSGNGKGIYDKAAGTVRLYFQWSNTANVAANATLFTIPDAYRPSAAVTGYGMIRTSADVPLPANHAITTTGAISQTASNASRGGFAVIEYIL